MASGEQRAAGEDRQPFGRRLIAFADCQIDGAYAQPQRGIVELQRAIGGLGLAGLKIHPHNLRASADDPRLLMWFDAADELNVPVVVHSNPSGYAPDFHGSAPARIYRAMVGGGRSFVVAHMGGVSHLETLVGGGYVDMSGTLLWLAHLYGLPFCGRFLRRIGIDRLLFATDYPIYSYEAYYQILDALDFADAEIEKIAHANAERMLAGLPPAEPAD